MVTSTYSRSDYGNTSKVPRLSTQYVGTVLASLASISDRFEMPVSTSMVSIPPLMPNSISVLRRSPIKMAFDLSKCFLIRRVHEPYA